ncbi:MAG: lipopolysaccharide heptosyltransferase II [Verrucomicrobiota bacterium]
MSKAREKILIRGVNWLGDAVMSTPALQRLREAKPEAHITLLTHEKLADLWLDHPALDAVLTFANNESAWHVGQKLRREKFDIGLALPNSHRSAIELWAAGIPQRIGYTRLGRNLFLTKSIQPRTGAIEMRKRSVAEIKALVEGRNTKKNERLPLQGHHIFQYLHLVAALGAKPDPIAPQLFVSEKEISAFRTRLSGISDSHPSLWLGLNPGADYGPAKRWPTERFIAAALEVHQKTNCGWIIFGAKDSATAQVAGALEKKLGRNFATNLSGKTTLRELCAGLKFCKLVLTNDTGPMHVAAAVGTPVVVPFGSTSAELTGPSLSENNGIIRASVPCAPCFLRECPIDFRCMNSIEVDHVVSACLSILKKL